MSNIQKLKNLSRAFFSFLFPKKWGIISEIYSLTRFDAPVSVSYAQGAEDLALLHFVNKERGFYIDIGAHHPNRFSVTRRLYDRGWVGINVDANPELENAFTKWRPRDKFLNFAVGTKEQYRFTRFEESAFSTVNSEWREELIQGGNSVLDEVIVKGITMRELFDMTPDNAELDVVNIDIEQGDIDALDSLGDTRNLPQKMPTWLLCESPSGVQNALNSSIAKKIIALGYKPWAILPLSTLFRKD